MALGRVDAPVVVAEWGDFQCPFCRAFTLDTEPALVSQYVESGQVRLEWHDFAYLGPESVLAARGARAAGRQGKFWEFHDTLYRNQPPENSGALTEASLAETARGLGLDPARFAGDFADPAITAQVDRDQDDGARLGVTGVPSFLINGQLVVGAQPVAAFRQVIDGALAHVR
ncbi:MAG: DsbA family protein [Actinomycetota bacterium]|nr:DsbA family protein [Actinomycetota bacterium]